MYRIALVNMPFSAVEIPSIALTQLQSMVARRLDGRASLEIVYPSHDMCLLLGLSDYVATCDESSASGLGDWLFQRAAFPGLPDNADEMRWRYFPAHDRRRDVFERLAALRGQVLESFLDAVIAKYELDRVDMVGFTSMFGQNVACFALAHKLKERTPGLVATMGGANCESPMGEEIVRHVPALDYVFSGPALLSFPRRVECLLEGDREGTEHIPGVFTRANCRPGAAPDVAILGEELPIDEDVPLDYEPFLDAFESAFGETSVERSLPPALLFETSRGCWWGARAHCTFCGLNGSTMSYRAMQPERARALLQSLFAYAPRVRKLNCVDNIMPQDYPRAVFAGLDTPPGMSIFYEVKADLTAEDMEILSRAGVDSLQPGIEALATSTLKLMRKGMTSVGNVLFLRRCLLSDVHPGWNLLVGFPGEDEEVYRKYVDDLPRLTHLPPPITVFPVRFDRYSPYFTQAREYGLDLAPLDFYPMIYPFPPEALDRMAYYFADRNIAAPYFLAVASWIALLRRQQAAWTAAWLAGRPPVLCFESPGSTRIRDSRSGREVIHDVGPTGRQALEALAEPAHHADLGKLASLDWESELARLRALGLLFEDGPRLISLVLPHPTPAERVLRNYLSEASAVERAA
jgi:magnesium-protoporphyrin IX monomethyl ester (oxidative) cyclase